VLAEHGDVQMPNLLAETNNVILWRESEPNSEHPSSGAREGRKQQFS